MSNIQLSLIQLSVTPLTTANQASPSWPSTQAGGKSTLVKPCHSRNPFTISVDMLAFSRTLMGLLLHCPFLQSISWNTYLLLDQMVHFSLGTHSQMVSWEIPAQWCSFHNFPSINYWQFNDATSALDPILFVSMVLSGSLRIIFIALYKQQRTVKLLLWARCETAVHLSYFCPICFVFSIYQSSGWNVLNVKNETKESKCCGDIISY